MKHYGLISTEGLSLLQPLFNSPWMEKNHTMKRKLLQFFKRMGVLGIFVSSTFLYSNMTLVNRHLKCGCLQFYKFLGHTWSHFLIDKSMVWQIAKIVGEIPQVLASVCCVYTDKTLLYLHICMQMPRHECFGLSQFQTVQFQQQWQQAEDEDSFFKKAFMEQMLTRLIIM